MKSARAIAFEFRPSRRVALAVCAVAALAIAGLCMTALAWWIEAVLGGVAALYAGLALRRFLAAPTRRAAWFEAGHWRLADAAGSETSAELEHAIVRGPWIILQLRRSDRRIVRMLLAPDNSSAEDRRRLRVRIARGEHRD